MEDSTQQEQPKHMNGIATIEQETISLSLGDNFQRLDTGNTKIHLETLSKMLRTLSTLVYNKIPSASAKGDNPSFEKYLYRLADTVDIMVLRSYLETNRSEGIELNSQCAIDPTESGFPIIIRDFRTLEQDKEEAAEKLKSLPTDKQIINDAIFTLCRGFFPMDKYVQKLERDFYQKINDTDIVHPLKVYPDMYFQKNGNANNHLYKKSIERLDHNNNLPRFYTIYFRVTNQVKEQSDWHAELEKRVTGVLTSVNQYELQTMAKQIEDIDGIMLDLIERFDVGPFYTKQTKNTGAIATLLEDATDNDGVLSFRRYWIQRVQEQKKTGLINKLSGMLSGDPSTGFFSDVIMLPKVMLMPHRLIQKAVNQRLDFNDEVQFYGTTTGGDFCG